ncbi:hypothetical protein ACFYMI_03075 [Streptomyces collinus]|uniref:hypothetical protein n=1 Tax=Streptomyces collinus TaxID=42684 RepID=UPI0036A891AF
MASKSRVHDVFTSTRLPAWGLLQVLTEALVETAPGADLKTEEARLHALWLAASASEPEQPAAQRHPVPGPGEDHVPNDAPILAMRVAWESPAVVEVERRRALRACVTKALEDVGYSDPDYRRDGSAGSTVAIAATQEHPSLTASVFLEAVDYEFAQSPPQLRFMAHLAATVRQRTHGIGEAVADLETFFKAEQLEPYWFQVSRYDSYPHSRPTGAVLHGFGTRPHADFWGEWTEQVLEVPYRGGTYDATFWCRTRSDIPF